MAAQFSLEQMARVRDGARRLVAKATKHEGDVRKLLASAESSLEQSRTAWSEHDSSAGDLLTQALQAQLLRSADDVATARLLCLGAREHSLAAERLANDLDGSARGSGEAPLGIAVLLVDDYHDSRELLRGLLENAGFTVRTASNGLEAVIAAYEVQPAVIVMDVQMPVLNGIEAARVIKAIDELKETRLIAYTASAPQAPLGELFTEVIRKPAPPDVVVETVKRWATA